MAALIKVLFVTATLAALFGDSSALTAGKKSKGSKGEEYQREASSAVDKEGKVIAAEGDSVDRDTVALVPTRSGCSCADSYDVGAGDCDDGEAVYSGCMATACDGDSTTDEDGTVWPSWCHTVEAECAGNNGANWDYCDPATAAVVPDAEREDDGGAAPAPTKKSKKTKKSKNGDAGQDEEADRNPDDGAGKTKKPKKVKKKKGPKTGDGESEDPEGRLSGSGSGAEAREGSGSADDAEARVGESEATKAPKSKKEKKTKKPKTNGQRLETATESAVSHSSSPARTLAVLSLVVLAVGAAAVIKRKQSKKRGYDIINPQAIPVQAQEDVSLLRSQWQFVAPVDTEEHQYQYYLEY